MRPVGTCWDLVMRPVGTWRADLLGPGGEPCWDLESRRVGTWRANLLDS